MLTGSTRVVQATEGTEARNGEYGPRRSQRSRPLPTNFVIFVFVVADFFVIFVIFVANVLRDPCGLALRVLRGDDGSRRHE